MWMHSWKCWGSRFTRQYSSDYLIYSRVLTILHAALQQQLLT